MKPEDSTEDDELVTEPERIAEILDELNRHLVLINVRLDPDGPLYDSLLMRLDPAQNRLYLDELTPVVAGRVLLPGDSFSVFASLRGIAIRFTITIEAVLPDTDQTLYVCQYPEEIGYLQRRDIFRVHLPLYERRQVKIKRREWGGQINTLLVDLSVKGFCLEMSTVDSASHPIGSHFDYYDMVLPDLQTPLFGEATLVNLRPSPRPGSIYAGFIITNLDAQTERALMRVTLYYQREARKLVD